MFFNINRHKIDVFSYNPGKSSHFFFSNKLKKTKKNHTYLFEKEKIEGALAIKKSLLFLYCTMLALSLLQIKQYIYESARL